MNQSPSTFSSIWQKNKRKTEDGQVISAVYSDSQNTFIVFKEVSKYELILALCSEPVSFIMQTGITLNCWKCTSHINSFCKSLEIHHQNTPSINQPVFYLVQTQIPNEVNNYKLIKYPEAVRGFNVNKQCMILSNYKLRTECFRRMGISCIIHIYDTAGAQNLRSNCIKLPFNTKYRCEQFNNYKKLLNIRKKSCNVYNIREIVNYLNIKCNENKNLSSKSAINRKLRVRSKKHELSKTKKINCDNNTSVPKDSASKVTTKFTTKNNSKLKLTPVPTTTKSHLNISSESEFKNEISNESCEKSLVKMCESEDKVWKNVSFSNSNISTTEKTTLTSINDNVFSEPTKSKRNVTNILESTLDYFSKRSHLKSDYNLKSNPAHFKDKFVQNNDSQVNQVQCELSEKDLKNVKTGDGKRSNLLDHSVFSRIPGLYDFEFFELTRNHSSIANVHIVQVSKNEKMSDKVLLTNNVTNNTNVLEFNSLIANNNNAITNNNNTIARNSSGGSILNNNSHVTRIVLENNKNSTNILLTPITSHITKSTATSLATALSSNVIHTVKSESNSNPSASVIQTSAGTIIRNTYPPSSSKDKEADSFKKNVQYVSNSTLISSTLSNKNSNVINKTKVNNKRKNNKSTIVKKVIKNPTLTNMISEQISKTTTIKNCIVKTAPFASSSLCTSTPIPRITETSGEKPRHISNINSSMPSVVQLLNAKPIISPNIIATNQNKMMHTISLSSANKMQSTNANIVQFICKTNGKTIQLTPISRAESSSVVCDATKKEFVHQNQPYQYKFQTQQPNKNNLCPSSATLAVSIPSSSVTTIKSMPNNIRVSTPQTIVKMSPMSTTEIAKVSTRSIFEENYASFIKTSSTIKQQQDQLNNQSAAASKLTEILSSSSAETSALPKFNQAFGKTIYQTNVKNKKTNNSIDPKKKIVYIEENGNAFNKVTQGILLPQNKSAPIIINTPIKSATISSSANVAINDTSTITFATIRTSAAIGTHTTTTSAVTANVSASAASTITKTSVTSTNFKSCDGGIENAFIEPKLIQHPSIPGGMCTASYAVVNSTVCDGVKHNFNNNLLLLSPVLSDNAKFKAKKFCDNEKNDIEYPSTNLVSSFRNIVPFITKSGGIHATNNANVARVVPLTQDILRTPASLQSTPSHLQSQQTQLKQHKILLAPNCGVQSSQVVISTSPSWGLNISQGNRGGSTKSTNSNLNNSTNAAAPTKSVAPTLETPEAELTTDEDVKKMMSRNNDSLLAESKLVDSSTLEQLREFDLVLEQVKERSTTSNRSDCHSDNDQKMNEGVNIKLESSIKIEPLSSSVSESGGDSAAILFKESSMQDDENSKSLSSFMEDRKLSFSKDEDELEDIMQQQEQQSTAAKTIVHTSNILLLPKIKDMLSEAEIQVIESIKDVLKTEGDMPPVSSQSTPNKSDSAPAIVSTSGDNKTSSELNLSVSISSPKSSPQTQSSQPAKPAQKQQEDEHTVKRIYNILAEYAEQLRNSPDLNNKPAPRRRYNPPTNPPEAAAAVATLTPLSSASPLSLTSSLSSSSTSSSSSSSAPSNANNGAIVSVITTKLENNLGTAELLTDTVVTTPQTAPIPQIGDIFNLSSFGTDNINILTPNNLTILDETTNDDININTRIRTPVISNIATNSITHIKNFDGIQSSGNNIDINNVLSSKVITTLTSTASAPNKVLSTASGLPPNSNICLPLTSIIQHSAGDQQFDKIKKQVNNVQLVQELLTTNPSPSGNVKRQIIFSDASMNKLGTTTTLLVPGNYIVPINIFKTGNCQQFTILSPGNGVPAKLTSTGSGMPVAHHQPQQIIQQSQIANQFVLQNFINQHNQLSGNVMNTANISIADSDKQGQQLGQTKMVNFGNLNLQKTVLNTQLSRSVQQQTQTHPTQLYIRTIQAPVLNNKPLANTIKTSAVMHQVSPQPSTITMKNVSAKSTNESVTVSSLMPENFAARKVVAAKTCKKQVNVGAKRKIDNNITFVEANQSPNCKMKKPNNATITTIKMGRSNGNVTEFMESEDKKKVILLAQVNDKMKNENRNLLVKLIEQPATDGKQIVKQEDLKMLTLNKNYTLEKENNMITSTLYQSSTSDCVDSSAVMTSAKKSKITTASPVVTNNHRMLMQAALEREIRLQKVECEDLGVDVPSTSDLFPEADIPFDSSPFDLLRLGDGVSNSDDSNNLSLPKKSVKMITDNNNVIFSSIADSASNKKNTNIDTDGGNLKKIKLFI